MLEGGRCLPLDKATRSIRRPNRRGADPVVRQFAQYCKTCLRHLLCPGISAEIGASLKPKEAKERVAMGLP